MPCSNRLLKLASLLLLSCLFNTSVSPSFAADRSDPMTPQQLADVYGLRRSSEGDGISESKPISQADFLRSADAFFSQTGRAIAAESFPAEANTAMHSIAITYFLRQVDSLQTETDRLMVEATRRGQHPQPRQAHSIKLGGRLLRTHSKESWSKPYALRAKQLMPAASVEDYDSALEQLSSFGIDLRQPDGSFAPDQLLTQGDYLRHLRQLDVTLIEVTYGLSADIESMVTVDLAQSQGPRTISASNDRLTNVLDQIAQVKALIYRLQDLVGDPSVQGSLKADWKAAAGSLSSKTLQLAQTDGANSEETLATQGEFALYMAQKLNQLPSEEVSFITRERMQSQAADYATLQGQLALMVEELENAIAQLN